MTSSNFNLATYLADRKARAEAAMRQFMPERTRDPANLHDAMHYSLFADGKRVRPILVLATAEALGVAEADVLPIAAAMEMIHVFSLVHDDLPAMDDDDLRRGQPTNHKVYGEAVAILAGDALLAQAFVPLSALNAAKYGAPHVLAVIRLFADATGAAGMIGGQIIDLESEGKKIPLERLVTLHRMKTGALIRASVLAPAVLSGASDGIREKLAAYGDAIGLAFQIADDILDIEGGAAIGKDVGSDIEKGKSTYPALLGMDGAKRERTRMLEAALAALEDFDERAAPLRELAKFIVERKK